MTLGSLGALMKDWTCPKVGLHGAKCVLYLRQGRVRAPDCLGIALELVKFDDVATVLFVVCSGFPAVAQ